MPNMKNSKILVYLAAALMALSSCKSKAVVEGSFCASPADGRVIVKTMEAGSITKVLDTLTLSDNGTFRYSFPVEKGKPEFAYLYCGDTKVASLLLKAGDRVKVQCDTIGFWTVSGSDDCAQLLQIEKDFSALVASGTVTLKDYVEYYRKMTKYVLSNAHSLTIIPVLFQKVGDVPVFNQKSDAVIFSALADSLSASYPESRWVEILRKEAKLRGKILSLDTMISSAKNTAYPDLFLPDIKGNTIQLSEIALKATLLVFWDATEPNNKIYNNDVLAPLYAQFRTRGLQIYAVCPTGDKPTWAMVVREQDNPWINVCDTRGNSLGMYGVTEVPSLFIVSENGVQKLSDITLAGLTKSVQAALK